MRQKHHRSFDQSTLRWSYAVLNAARNSEDHTCNPSFKKTLLRCHHQSTALAARASRSNQIKQNLQLRCAADNKRSIMCQETGQKRRARNKTGQQRLSWKTGTRRRLRSPAHPPGSRQSPARGGRARPARVHRHGHAASSARRRVQHQCLKPPAHAHALLQIDQSRPLLP